MQRPKNLLCFLSFDNGINLPMSGFLVSLNMGGTLWYT